MNVVDAAKNILHDWTFENKDEFSTYDYFFTKNINGCNLKVTMFHAHDVFCGFGWHISGEKFRINLDILKRRYKLHIYTSEEVSPDTRDQIRIARKLLEESGFTESQLFLSRHYDDICGCNPIFGVSYSDSDDDSYDSDDYDSDESDNE